MIVMMMIVIVTFQCRNNVVQFSNSLLGSALGQGVVAKNIIDANENPPRASFAVVCNVSVMLLLLLLPLLLWEDPGWVDWGRGLFLITTPHFNMGTPISAPNKCST